MASTVLQATVLSGTWAYTPRVTITQTVIVSVGQVCVNILHPANINIHLICIIL